MTAACGETPQAVSVQEGGEELQTAGFHALEPSIGIVQTPFPSDPSFRGVVSYLWFGRIASRKRKKPETILWRPTFSDNIFVLGTAITG